MHATCVAKPRGTTLAAAPNPTQDPCTMKLTRARVTRLWHINRPGHTHETKNTILEHNLTQPYDSAIYPKPLRMYG